MRYEYVVERRDYRPSGRALPEGFDIRPPTNEDRSELAELMMDAYVGTIDYDGETLEQAVEEVGGAFSAKALLDQSRVAEIDGVIESAVLVSLVDSEAFIGYVMTRAAVKNRGHASALLDQSATAIWEAGYDRIRAWLTDGNTPSERIFLRAGFQVVGSNGTK